MLSATDPAAPFACKRILIVEDEGIVARDLKRRLEKQGFAITGIADNAAAAMQLAEQDPPDLVLMDIIIQGDRDGITTAHELRVRLDVPVVFLTAHSDTATVQRAKAALPYGYLVKPFEERELLTTIEMAAYRHQMEGTQRLYQRAISAATTGMMITDARQPDNPIIACNAACEHITGYAEAELLGKNPRLFQGKCTDPATVKIMSDAVRSGSGCKVTVRNHRKDGTPFWNEVHISPLCDASGRLTHFIGIQNDVTTQKEAEERIRQQAQLIDLATDAIFVCDTDRRVQLWNAGAERLYGFSLQEVLNGPIIERICRESDQHRDLVLRTVFEQGQWHGEMRHKTRDGRDLVVLANFTLLKQQQGDPSGILAVCHDLTETKALEERLLRSQRQETLGALAGGIAHDLNNALAPILMGSDLLKAKYPGAPGIVDLFDSSARRAADMVRQLLTFAKGVGGERAPVPAIHLLREMQGMIQSTFPKNINIVLDYEKELPPIIGDVTQIHQVLLNFCINARDAMPAGGTLTLRAKYAEIGLVHVGMPPNARTGHFVALSVQDTGTGIPPEIRERIFDPFFTTKPTGKGTGLGLATVLGIVKSHDGFIDVSSEQEKGTVFTAFLPADPATPPHEALHARWTPPFQARGQTILFVDDEPAVREVAREVLQRLNFRVVLASDGIDALMWLNEHRDALHAVITDLHMPNQDGLVFVQVLKRVLPRVPVIVSSGKLEESTRAEFEALGISHFLDKPSSHEQLARMLQEIFSIAEDRAPA
ncbi:MAG: response regulator [Verrucomicrobiaceae bacterium]